MKILTSIVLVSILTSTVFGQGHPRHRKSGSVSAMGAEFSRIINFSNLYWKVKSSSSPVGPGPNNFSDSYNNVWVDSSGRLHLKITRKRGVWYCAEVCSLNSFGYGTYKFYLDSSAATFDPNIVLGLFTWSDSPDFNNREIDIEFSRWGDPLNTNSQYVVQPYYLPGNTFSFVSPEINSSLHMFEWKPDYVSFNSYAGGSTQQWTYTGAVPQPGDENVRMNLWLYTGERSGTEKSVEVIINRFEFVPAN
jgi:hypothetical protein